MFGSPSRHLDCEVRLPSHRSLILVLFSMGRDHGTISSRVDRAPSGASSQLVRKRRNSTAGMMSSVDAGS